jgi:hypothetical protein
MANKETKELLNFGVLLVNAGASALKDGKIDVMDAFQLVKVFTAAGPAFNNASGALAEFKTWSEVERAEIFGLIRGIDLADDVLEKNLEKALQAALLLAEVLSSLMKA